MNNNDLFNVALTISLILSEKITCIDEARKVLAYTESILSLGYDESVCITAGLKT